MLKRDCKWCSSLCTTQILPRCSLLSKRHIFYGTRVNAILFTPTRQVRPFLFRCAETRRPSLTLCSYLFWWISWSDKCGKYDGNLFTTLIKVWLSVRQFSRNSLYCEEHLVYPILYKTYCTNCGRILFTSLRKLWLSFHQFSRNPEQLNDIMPRSSTSTFTHIDQEMWKCASRNDLRS